MNFTAIDFETANSDRASVCEIGLAIVANGQIVKEVSQLIRPEPLLFDPFNVSIHGISAADVAAAPTFSEFWPSLWANVSGPLVAHNAAFDVSVLRRSLDRCGTPYPEADYFCTRIIAKRAWPDLPTYALDFIARSLGIVFKHHDAVEDARTCALVALSACNQVNVAALHDLQDVFGFCVGRLFDGGYCPCGVARVPRHARSEPDRKLRVLDAVLVKDQSVEKSACCGRTFVFTGTLISMERKSAIQAVVDRGGICHDRIRPDSDYLVVGQDGFKGYQAGYKSSKIQKAESMRIKGFRVEIVSEADFLMML
jgi:DNA polymerase-3 subunit epsilon